MKRAGLLAVSFKGVNFGFWCQLGLTLSCAVAKVSFRVAHEETKTRYLIFIRFIYFRSDNQSSL